MDGVWDEWWISLKTPGAFQPLFLFSLVVWNWNAVFSRTRGSESRFFLALLNFRPDFTASRDISTLMTLESRSPALRHSDFEIRLPGLASEKWVALCQPPA
jgi:hypothetical protein